MSRPTLRAVEPSGSSLDANRQQRHTIDRGQRRHESVTKEVAIVIALHRVRYGGVGDLHTVRSRRPSSPGLITQSVVVQTNRGFRAYPDVVQAAFRSRFRGCWSAE